MMTDVVIVAAKRTPLGAFQGALSHFKAPELGAAVLQDLLQNTNVEGHEVSEVYMGCVLSAGLGQAPARQASIKAGISQNTPATTINKVCGSGLKAIMLACDQVRLGQEKIVLAGGMESMTNAPYLLDRARSGYRLGHGKVLDHMYLDGLEDAYQAGRLMGTFAEDTAEKYRFSRKDQDDFAIESLRRALEAVNSGVFDQEIVPLTLPKGDIITRDEPPLKGKPEKIPTLKPVFKDGGTVTAANSSSISDGAAAVMVMTQEEARRRNLKPLARVLGYTSHAQEPQWFTTAPINAMSKLSNHLKCSLQDMDLLEINEAFAVVPMAAIKDLSLDPKRVNINGGACALGHPIGASGARLLVTLIHAMRAHKKHKGMVSLCIGGGEAVAMAIEVL